MSTHLVTSQSSIRRMACAAALSLPLLASAAEGPSAQGIQLRLYVAYGEPPVEQVAAGGAIDAGSAVRRADALTIDNCAAVFTARAPASGTPLRLANAGVLVLWLPPGCEPGSACAGAATEAAGGAGGVSRDAAYFASDDAGHSLIP